MKKGFTLIELLVVVLIIGILTSVALPQYKKAVKKARVTEVLLAMAEVEKRQQLSYLEKRYVESGIYPKFQSEYRLKHFQVGSYLPVDSYESFVIFSNDDIYVMTHFIKGKSIRYCTGKCTDYFAGGCQDSEKRHLGPWDLTCPL
jgi:prepilin-type N-terminal cleavage/methylation domain-containing protein